MAERTIIADGMTIHGGTVHIMRALREIAFDQGKNLNEYLDILQTRLNNFNGPVDFSGDTIEERCENAVAELLRIGMAKETEEESK